MTSATLVLVGMACVACGDNVAGLAPLAAENGTRLHLEGIAYLDGSRQWDPTSFYDSTLHATCRPGPWADDTIRCVPDAEPAVFVDAECNMVVGRTSADGEPDLFIAPRVGELGARPYRLFRAGAATTAPAQYYVLRDTGCDGPFASPLDARYYTVTNEQVAIVLTEDMRGEGRLGLNMVTGTDGMQVPFALHDRDLDVDCWPVLGDASAACEPVNAPTASYFADEACTTPAVNVVDGTTMPNVVRVDDATGCPAYRSLGSELAGAVYFKTGTWCLAASHVGQRFYSLGGPVELQQLTARVETTPGRRLQRVVLETDGLATVHTRLYDTATRAECVEYTVDQVTRCLPQATANAATLYDYGCAVPIDVAELAAPTCTRPSFAITQHDNGFDVHLIGAPYTGPAYRLDDAVGCVPYTSAAGRELHALGPALPGDTFVPGVRFGSR